MLFNKFLKILAKTTNAPIVNIRNRPFAAKTSMRSQNFHFNLSDSVDKRNGPSYLAPPLVNFTDNNFINNACNPYYANKNQ